jgi:hypothetical protein
MKFQIPASARGPNFIATKGMPYEIIRGKILG